VQTANESAEPFQYRRVHLFDGRQILSDVVVAVPGHPISVVGVRVGRTVVDRPVVHRANAYDTFVGGAPVDPARVDRPVVDVVLHHVAVVERTVRHVALPHARAVVRARAHHIRVRFRFPAFVFHGRVIFFHRAVGVCGTAGSVRSTGGRPAIVVRGRSG